MSCLERLDEVGREFFDGLNIRVSFEQQSFRLWEVTLTRKALPINSMKMRYKSTRYEIKLGLPPNLGLLAYHIPIRDHETPRSYSFFHNTKDLHLIINGCNHAMRANAFFTDREFDALVKVHWRVVAKMRLGPI